MSEKLETIDFQKAEEISLLVDSVGFFYDIKAPELINSDEGFNIYTYRANLLHDGSTPERKSLETYRSMELPGKVLSRELQKNGYSGISDAWNMMSAGFDAIDDISSLHGLAVKEKDIYAAIILDALETSTKLNNVDTLTSVIKYEKDIVSYAKK